LRYILHYVRISLKINPNNCYEIPQGVSRITFKNNELFKNKFTIMIYDKVRCEGNFIAWSKKIGPFATFDSGFIASMNDKIAGWKNS
jgi:hypothetical protein